MVWANQGRICVEITDDELRWLWCCPQGRDKMFNPEHFEITPLPQGVVQQGKIIYPEAFQAILQGYLEKLKSGFKVTHKPRVNIALPMQNQFIRQYNLPWVKKSNRPGLIGYLAEEEIPIVKEELVYDYYCQEPKDHKANLKLVMAGIRETILVPVTSAFVKAGFTINKVTFSPVAYGNALKFGTEDNAVLVGEDEGQIQCIFYKGAVPELVRTFPSTEYYNPDEWQNELQRLHIFFTSLNDQLDELKIIWHKGAIPEELSRKIGEYWQDKFGKRPVLETVEEVCQRSLQKALMLSAYKSEKYLAVLGLAREGKEDINNFWRWENRKQKKQKLHRTLASAMLLLSMGGLTLTVSYQENLQSLRLDVERLQAVHSSQVLAAELDKKQRETWEKLVNQSTTVGKAVKELTAYDSEGIKIDRMEIKEHTIVLQGQAAQSLFVEEIYGRLYALEWENVQLVKYQVVEDYLSEGLPIQFVLKAEKYD